MKQPVRPSKIGTKPAIARWELWTVAQMLVSTHGNDAETHALAKLGEAKDQSDEAGEIVWSGIMTQLKRIREGEN